jgi:hypothetical protein
LRLMKNWAPRQFLSPNMLVIEALMDDLPAPGTPVSQNSRGLSSDVSQAHSSILPRISIRVSGSQQALPWST